MARKGITLVEMLVAMAITLVMMAAVVTVFANVSGSVQRRRATIELNTQIRHVRSVLQRDLEGATCPALPWQRPESNHGYLEIVEGPYSDIHPSQLTDGINDDSIHNHELDPRLSIVPQYDDGFEDRSPVRSFRGTLVQRDDSGNVVSTLNGLGDYDDVLALTVRNEEEPFTGNVPNQASVRPNQTDANPFANWTSQVIESPLAEVVWFAVENPEEHDDASGFFGEPGLRTIYRRTLLIAPWVAPYRYTDPTTGALSDTYEDPDSGDQIRTEPGVVRVLSDDVDGEDQGFALAALVAFQDRYDLSVRLEWDPRLGEDGRWKIVANTLADLTKRENRYEHHYYHTPDTGPRLFPFAMVSVGGGYSGQSEQVNFFLDIELPGADDRNSDPASAEAVLSNFGITDLQYLDRYVSHYVIDPSNVDPNANKAYFARPFAFVGEESTATPPTPATARAILNDEGWVVHVVHGPAPLWGQRRGEDVMLTDALGFDIRVFDPGAPIFKEPSTEVVLQPSDPGWVDAYLTDRSGASDLIGDNSTSIVRYLGQGAFVDLGYGLVLPPKGPLLPPRFDPRVSAVETWFFDPRWTPNRVGRVLAPGYSVYDTWSFHYENNGLNEDGDIEIDENDQQKPMIDEGTNGFDDLDPTYAGNSNVADRDEGDIPVNGVDDVGERETTPPYDRPLRGIQIKLRGFERDSQQIREVTVNQHFVPE